MSTLYYLVCTKCRKSVEVGKNGSLWWADPVAMKRVSDWLADHEGGEGEGHPLEYLTEHYLPEDCDPTTEEE